MNESFNEFSSMSIGPDGKIIKEEEITKEIDVLFPAKFWEEKIKENEKVNEKVGNYSHLVVETIPPRPSSGYEKLILSDFILDGKKVDIYGSKEDNSWHSVYLHVKE